MDCDILVIGAGPAGSCAAEAAAKKGARVLVAERRKIVGVPVRCAGYIPRPLLGGLPFRDRSFIIQPVKAMRTVLPDGTIKETRAPGLIIGRERFDNLLAHSARCAGAHVHTGLRAVDKKQDDILLKDAERGMFWTRPAVIIGGDGPHSTVGRWMGQTPPRSIPGIQVRVSLTSPMDHTAVYFHPRIFGAYGWVFPRGDEANVGLALSGGDGFPRSLKATLKWFVEKVAAEGKIKPGSGKLIFGWIPVEPRAQVLRNNMMLAGDAAGHTHPITGAGIANAMLAGRLAGKWAVRALRKGDLRVMRGYAETMEEELKGHPWKGCGTTKPAGVGLEPVIRDTPLLLARVQGILRR
ncbi:MAG: NAD(P)/FAD-dependent oxidoreductase [Deltaproteobacteria bacterium]|nr:NAD(P)/FAD-dependent oxidoreductase [Deltaproteobacteria bacterium]